VKNVVYITGNGWMASELITRTAAESVDGKMRRLQNSGYLGVFSPGGRDIGALGINEEPERHRSRSWELAGKHSREEFNGCLK
jgi:hypothetical protein